MGIRGIFGFYYKGKYYVVYNHCDSYPSNLGVCIVKEIRDAIENGVFNRWLEMLLTLKVVHYKDKPTSDDIEKCKEFTDLTVSTKSVNEYYCLLRKCQGSINKVFKSGYLLNHADNDLIIDPHDDIEYGYVINYDTNKLDFHSKEGIKSFDFDNLPNW